MRVSLLFFSIVVLMMPMMPVAFPQNIAVAQEGNVTRTLPETVLRGETFNAIVTFITPIKADVISIWDYAPVGWSVQAKAIWCTPPTSDLKVTNNAVEAIWNKAGGFPVGTAITILYKVTVPAGAPPGFHNFSESEQGNVRYHKAGTDEHTNWTEEYITGDSRVEVILPEIYVTPSNLAFDAGLGGLTPGNQTLFIWNSGKSGTTLNWALSDNAGWLWENPAYGSSTSEDDKTPVGVSVNITGMSAGDYYANITITDPEAVNSPRVIPVTLHISPPEIAVAPPSLAFGAVQGGLTPGNQTLFIWNSGDIGTRLNWALSDDADWLEENATTGNSTAEDDKTAVGVSVNITGKSAGDYYANITITDPEAVNSPELIPVTLHISPPSSGGGGGGGGGKPEIVRGDLNGDVVVDERDLTLLKEIILGLEDGTANADLNGDGKINALDITALKRIICGKE
jgi:hypothetical protein